MALSLVCRAILVVLHVGCRAMVSGSLRSVSRSSTTSCRNSVMSFRSIVKIPSPADHRANLIRIAADSHNGGAGAIDIRAIHPAEELERAVGAFTQRQGIQTRCLRRDWTVAHHGQLYQVRSNVRATHVIVEDRVDGTMRMTHNGRPLTYQAIGARPLRVPSPPKIARPQRIVTPTRTHPWRKRLLPEGRSHAAVGIT